MTNASASNRPGMMPAMNRSPTDFSVSTPYKINSRLGGISMPSTEEPATTPTEKRGVWPWRSISGTATFVNTAAEAIEMPVMAAKTVLAPTVAMPSPPRTRRKIWLATSKVSLPISATETNRPIRTNSGTTPKM